MDTPRVSMAPQELGSVEGRTYSKYLPYALHLSRQCRFPIMGYAKVWCG